MQKACGAVLVRRTDSGHADRLRRLPPIEAAAPARESLDPRGCPAARHGARFELPALRGPLQEAAAAARAGDEAGAIFEAGGVEASELYALAGVNATGERPLVATAPARAPADARTIRIEELDVRASAGAGLTGENEKVVAEWQVPSGAVRGYSTAPATEMRIITVMGDSMEPALLPGQRVLVDTGDRKPSPPGIFVVWDGLGLVIKRVQMVPHSEPPRVKITSDNVKYETYERSLEEAYIQGRVIGQWRWL